jgi:lipoate-protein ligase A
MSTQFGGLFFEHFQGDPYFNMAFDEWLLRRASACRGVVLARLYTWSVGSITFGFNQDRETALDWSRVRETPVIRRITGGRALYHDPSELTYAIAANLSSGTRLDGTVGDVSRRIARALQQLLDGLSIESQYVRQSSTRNSRPEFFHKAPCFASTAKYELVTGDRKIVASAQKRTRTAFVQHGSIKLSGIAPHPALNGVAFETAGSLQPIDADAFSRAAALFWAACEVHFDVRLRRAGPADYPATLSSLVAECEKKALLRRTVD